MPKPQNMELFKKLHSDLDELSKRFISIYGLAYSASVPNLVDPLARWLDFRMRYIEPKPRSVVYSNKFPKTLPTKIENGWKVIKRKIESGEDINPYQGKGLIEHNDTSSKKPEKRTDLLWASWGIFHLHLTDSPVDPNSYFSERSDYQAFIAFDDTTVAVIDIREHLKGEGYSDPDFLHIIAENWPYALEHAELKGILPGESYTAKEIHQLRKVGVNSAINIKGKTYMNPGVGLTSAGTSLNIQMLRIRINDAVRVLSDSIELNPAFKEHTSNVGVVHPNFGLTIIPKGLSLYEEHSRSVFNFNNAHEVPGIILLQDFIFPKWALAKYATSTYADNF